jgi:prevent-host-death family protein
MYALYMAAEMTVSEARADLGPVTSRAEYAGETTYLTKHGRRAAAVVPAGSAELPEGIAELLDVQAVHSALAELEPGTEERVPFVRRTTRHRTS